MQKFQEIHSIVDDLSVRLGGVGEEWLTSSESSPKYFEFTPIEMYAITERLRLPEPTAPGEWEYHENRLGSDLKMQLIMRTSR
ncbi:unnamed protein product [Strongylus vulgaris]|uniref:Uncharacterized protein n=1 Tax=Strongylus vulgaris TaxID=40348 RepID=A0A3P7J812_STRVU|nr:unnamed protein product [Strongylus vulgaris]